MLMTSKSDNVKTRVKWVLLGGWCRERFHVCFLGLGSFMALDGTEQIVFIFEIN